MSEIIDVKHLSFAYKKQNVVDDISFKIKKGEWVSIQGPSGSGKSTLLYLLGGMLAPDKGSIQIDHSYLTELSQTEKALFRNDHLGFIFQQFHLLPGIDVFQNTIIPEQYSSQSDIPERAKFLLKRLGISELGSLPNQLSGGQQQRVAIARALVTGAEIILADEPTGNLDSKNTEEILSLFEELNKDGKTILVITHDKDVAERSHRILNFKDGKIESERQVRGFHKIASKESSNLSSLRSLHTFNISIGIRNAFSNLLRQKLRTTATMLGIVIGIASILSMLSLGSFTKEKILQSYQEMGANTVSIRGYPNWELKATDEVGSIFYSFNWITDLAPLKTLFPSIKRLAPILDINGITVTFGGSSIDNDVQMIGTNEDGAGIGGKKLAYGRPLTFLDVENRSPVCSIGPEIVTKLFKGVNPIGEIIALTPRYGENPTTFSCKVIGVFESKSSNKGWRKPDLEIVIPFTLFPEVISDGWNSSIHEVLVDFYDQDEMITQAKSVSGFFGRKYGKSGEFMVSSDSTLIAQMRKFLNLFKLLLGLIASVSLLVGAVGIMNMMMVSVTERFREIGIRKAVGATEKNIRFQFLTEAIIICSVAGILGLILGVGSYLGAIYGASKVFPKMPFEWYLDINAVLISVVSIVAVGILSGIIPAIRAEKLQVIEALRSE